jgi:5-methylcytosine-specific restriction protein A
MIEEILEQLLTPHFFPTWEINGETYVELRGKMNAARDEIFTLCNQQYNITAHTGIGVSYMPNGQHLASPLRNLSEVPWIGIQSNNKSIDSNPQTGIYLAILFNASGSNFSLSLQFGTDSLKSKDLNSYYLFYKTLLGNKFSDSVINLTAKNKDGSLIKDQKRGVKYEKSNIFGSDYKINEVGTFLRELPVFIKLYETLIENLSRNDETSSQIDFTYEEPGNFSSLKRRHGSKYKASVIILIQRSNKEKSTAILKAGFECEIDSNHTTFETDSMSNYVEGHHIIPMKFYSIYTNDIDHWSNIVSLCPTCHRKVHFAAADIKKEILSEIWTKRGQQINTNYTIEKAILFDHYNLVE